MIGIIQNLDLLTVGLSTAAIGILGSIVYFSNSKSITNQSFFAFSSVTVAWSLFNYTNYQVTNPFEIILVLRLVMYSAVWYSFFLYQLFFVFPNEKKDFPKYYVYFIIPVTFLTSLLTFTPLVFSRVDKLAVQGQVSTVATGPGIFIFGLVVISLIATAIFTLYKKIKNAKTSSQKQQLRLVFIGALLTFSLHIIFNFILPAFFNQTKFIPLGALFTFPLIAFTTYSILKHHFLNLKIIATEFLTFAVAIAILFDVILSTDIVSRLFRFIIFLLITIFGVLLIKSVRREVEQKEQLEVLTGELAEANSKLQELDKARAEFISIASHQLRTPPATVKWYLSAALNGDYGTVNPEIKPVIEKAAQTNNHLISLIEDMLNVSRIERGKMEFLFEPTDTQELAKLAYEQLIPQASNKRLKLSYQPPAQALPKIMADKEKLRQVMNNLIDNAIKYTKEGTVDVSIYQKDDDICFAVKDSGKGISQEDKDNIFQKYSRGKESIKQSAGLGLGLYVAKIIIEQHKGKIWAESAGEAKGSIFKFSVPIHNNLSATTLVDFAKQ